MSPSRPCPLASGGRMLHLALFLNRVLGIEWIQGEAPALLDFGGEVYRLNENLISIFFDCLYSSTGEVVGLELHLIDEAGLEQFGRIREFFLRRLD